MPVIQGRTREQLRQHIGYALGALYVSSASTDGSTTTLVDNTLVLGGADNHIGKWMRLTSGDDDGAVRRITDSAVSSNVTTFTISNPDATANQVSNFIVKITQGTTTSTRNFTWATVVSNGTNIDWAGGAGPDITTGSDKIDILSFTSYDNGTTWYGAIVGQEFS